MPTPPRLLPTEVPEGSAPGVGYRIEGELVPTLHVALDGRLPIFFEHHVILWKQPQVDVVIRPMKGAFKRVIAGMPIFMTQAQGAGEAAFSRDGVGHVHAMHLQANESILVREHQFLAATGNMDFTFERVKGIGNMLFSSTGFFVDRFTAMGHEGVLWLHGYGNIFEKVLDPGEQIDVEPGGWVYRDQSVRMDPQVFGLKTGFLGGGGNLVFNRFTGPGRVGIQSMYVHMPEGAAGNAGAAVAGGAVGAVLKGLTGG